MRRTFLKTGIIVVCMVLTMGLLSACGASNPVGTWHEKGDSSESFFNIEEGGDVSYYNSEYDELSYGDWTENNGFYEISGFASGPMMCKLKNKNKLYCDDYDFTLKRGAERDIPAITTPELIYDSWVSADEKYEINFYGTGNWYLYDYDDEEYEYLEEGTYINEYGNVFMENTDGVEYRPTIAENRHEITVFDNMVFIKEAE